MSDFFASYQHNVGPGRDFEPASTLPPVGRDVPVRYITYYLPQFHSIEENDASWGKGFTEWTNVTKSLPRFKGHLQPRLPADLGFYRLDQVDTLYAQAELARQNGVAGFCIHDYWFSGHKVLGRPLELLLQHSDIDLPFCLNWANESWTRRWDGLESNVLIEQRYDPAATNGYIESILPAITDRRYITVDGRPLVMVYRPEMIPDARRVFDGWRDFLVREGLADPYLVMAQTFGKLDPRPFGMDAAAGFPPHVSDPHSPNLRDSLKLHDLDFSGFVGNYSVLADQILDNFETSYVTLPGVCPGWDNEARKPGRGSSYVGSSPDRYAAWLSRASQQVMRHNRPPERIVFINAWNEWAEGAILEPDRHYGHAFLNRTRDTLSRLSTGNSEPDTQPYMLDRPKINLYGNKIRRKLRKIRGGVGI